MKIINDINVKEITFKDLCVGDTFLYVFPDGECNNGDVYVRMTNIINDIGCTMNTFCLKDNCCTSFSGDAVVKKIECVVNVVEMSN